MGVQGRDQRVKARLGPLGHSRPQGPPEGQGALLHQAVPALTLGAAADHHQPQGVGPDRDRRTGPQPVQQPPLLRQEEGRARPQSRLGLPPPQREVTPGQVQHQVRGRVHQGGRLRPLQGLHHLGPHGGLLADATGPRRQAVDSVHGPRQGAVPMDHQPHGADRLPSLVRPAHGHRHEGPRQRDHLHRRRPHPQHGLRHAPRALARGAGTAQEAPPQAELGQVRDCDKGSRLSWTSADSPRNRARVGQGKGVARHGTAVQHQGAEELLGGGQLLPLLHPAVRPLGFASLQVDQADQPLDQGETPGGRRQGVPDRQEAHGGQASLGLPEQRGEVPPLRGRVVRDSRPVIRTRGRTWGVSHAGTSIWRQKGDCLRF